MKIERGSEVVLVLVISEGGNGGYGKVGGGGSGCWVEVWGEGKKMRVSGRVVEVYKVLGSGWKKRE